MKNDLFAFKCILKFQCLVFMPLSLVGIKHSKGMNKLE